MPTTLKAIQTALVARLKAAMEAVDMDIYQTASLNSDLVDPLTWALRTLEVVLVDPMSVTEAEIATVTDDDITSLLDLAEYRLLKTIINVMDQTDERLGPHGKWASQYPTRLKERLESEEKRIRRVYGVDASSIDFGMINIAEIGNVT